MGYRMYPVLLLLRGRERYILFVFRSAAATNLYRPIEILEDRTALAKGIHSLVVGHGYSPPRPNRQRLLRHSRKGAGGHKRAVPIAEVRSPVNRRHLYRGLSVW